MKDFCNSLGWRNNNPLNIRYSKSNNWQGQAGSEKGFCKFTSMCYGYRAALVLLHKYMKKNKCCTIETIVERWAPSSENDTEAYMRSVRYYMRYVFCRDVDVCDRLYVEDLPLLAYAMSCFEMGVPVTAHFNNSSVRDLLIPALQDAVDMLQDIFYIVTFADITHKFIGYLRK